MKQLLIACVLALTATVASAGGKEDPWLTMLNVEEFEWRSDDSLSWDAELWTGKNINRLWLRTEGEWTSEETEEFELQALYSRAITPFWNLQAGWRGDFRPATERDWLAVALRGMIPFFVDTELSAYFGDGRAAARAVFSYHLFLTQRWMLVPRFESNWFSDEDLEHRHGSGIADLELGLRLQYRITPAVMPYAGVNWVGLFGDTADLAELRGEDSSDWQAVAGLRIWF